MTGNKHFSVFLGVGLGLACSSPASATCPVPNTLTNGQVADADTVMDNFDALADCSVSTTGTPTNGSISVFSGSKSVSSGNLSGDVTTSGSTSTTLSASGVTPGTYSNPTVTVDAKGRVTAATSGSGGSGGGGIPFSKPLASSFGQVNFADASVTDGTYAMSFSADGVGNIDNWALLTQSQTGTFTKVVHLVTHYPQKKNFGGGGIILRESSSGKFIALFSHYNTWANGYIVRVDHYNGPNSYSSNPKFEGTALPISWLRVDVDSTNRTYSYSFDGVGWMELYSEAVGTFITSDQVGLGIFPRNESTPNNDVQLSVWHWGSPP